MHPVNSPRPAESAPSLSVRGMSKAFNGVPAIEDISIDVSAGEFHGLLGENGAGKSTLVKGLLGFHLPDAGRILVNGAEVSVTLVPILVAIILLLAPLMLRGEGE